MNYKAKVLIVEDNTALSELYQNRFKDDGFQVIVAKDGDSATTLAMSEIPDIIILDLLLPQKGGLGVLDILKTWPQTNHIPVIVLTAFPEDAYREKAIRDGAKAFYSKNEITPGEIVQKAKEILNIK